MDKESLRKYAKETRKKTNCDEMSEAICENIIFSDAFKSAKNVMIYYPFGSEINILKLTEKADKNWLLPRVNGDEMDVYFFKKGDTLSYNQWQIPEPCIEEQKAEKKDIDLVIIPGLCADKKGFRLGYGLGFYDRFLRNIPQKCKKLIPVISELFLDEVPKDLWDEPIDIVVTEKEIYQTKA